MFKAFKYRLEPNVNQTRELEISLETHRRLYNTCLEQRKITYETTKMSIRYADQCKWLTAERRTNLWLRKLNAQSSQATIRRLDRSFHAFFRRAKSGGTPGYPRFKGRDHFDSFTYPSVGNGARVVGRKLQLQHVGKVRINLHRPIEGEQKTITVKREASKWYVIVACEIATPAPTLNDHPGVGIDVGIESFLTTSDGGHVSSLQPLKWKLRKLRVEQRSLARCKRAGVSRRKRRSRVASLHYRIANYRRDQHHKIARDLVSRYGFIAVEILNIQGMSRNHRLARAVLDSGWGQFLAILKHKAESAGVQVVEVNACGTSQTCPECGATAKKTLGQRKHSCNCGYSTHRDHAAAQVILNRGQAGVQPGGRNVGVGPHGLRSRLL